MKPRVMVIFGTRPEAVKLGPVIHSLRESLLFDPIVTVTGQHREMLDQVLDVFGISPNFDLDLMQDRQTLSGFTARAVEELDRVIRAGRPDAVVVQGDTTTAFVGALCAYYCRVPVAHVEAGLRTFDPYSPFPEEINRRLATHLATLHLAPTAGARANLLAEGIDKRRVVVTGNTAIDALLWTAGRASDYGDARLRPLEHDPRRVILVTAHRRESWGTPMASIANALGEVARREPSVLIVFPIHRNPVVRETMVPALGGLPNVLLVDPLGYASFVHLMQRAHILLTDSGGIQEEGPSLGKPVLVMRETTERPEAVAAGTARLVGTSQAAIVAGVQELLHDRDAYARMTGLENPYGDGQAARRTVAALAHYFDLGPAVDEFRPTLFRPSLVTHETEAAPTREPAPA